jgi:ectoine hydroxylase-related dioxygenase (phytanoyl-CoA dioxygenase family)
LTVLYPDIKDQPGQLREGVRSHDFFEKEIEKRGAEIVSFIAEKGDVIIWHGHLVHRGSMPQNRNITRKSLIGHYCNLFANTSVTPDDKQWYEQSETVRNQMVSEYSDLFAKWGEGIYFRTP